MLPREPTLLKAMSASYAASRSWSSVLSLLLLFCGLSLQQTKDPLKDFCRRFDQQTAIIDDKLYIDGGIVNYNPLSQNPSNQTNQALLWADIKTPSKDGMPQLHTDVVTKSTNVPSVGGGILWEDSINKFFYLFGGYFPELAPTAFSLWAYDTIGNNWTAVPKIDSTFSRVAHGMGASVPDRGEGYYLGGYQDNRTTPGWGGPRQYSSNLVKFDFTTGLLTNSTGLDSVGRGEGVMLWIPASDAGILVYFGGITQVNGTLQANPMSQISIFDIASSKWYKQTASGDVPEDRMRFCAGATWAQDKSSYNIYLYGGLSPNGTNTAFDDVYILTMPAFVWIKWYPSQPGPGAPHHSLSCNVINGAQMIVMGGTFPASDQCDAPTVWGEHNLNLGKDNPEGAKWAAYNPAITTYKVPSEIIGVVGGGATGGATVKAPVQGTWGDRDLPVYFSRTASAAVRAPTRTIPNSKGQSQQKSKTPVGAIVGGVVGGIVALVALAVIAFICLRRRKGKTSSTQAELSGKDEKRDNSSSSSPKPAVNAIPVELATSPTNTQHGPFYQDDHRKFASVSGSEVHSPYSPANSPPIHSQTPSYHTHSPPPAHPQSAIFFSSAHHANSDRHTDDNNDVIRPEQFYNTGQHSPAHPQDSFDRRSPGAYTQQSFGSGIEQPVPYNPQERGDGGSGHVSPAARGYPPSASTSDTRYQSPTATYGRSPDQTYGPPSAGSGPPPVQGGRKFSGAGRSSYSNTPQQFYPPPPPPGTVQQARDL